MVTALFSVLSSDDGDADYEEFLHGVLAFVNPGDAVVDLNASVRHAYHDHAQHQALPVGLWIGLLYPSCRVTLVVEDNTERCALQRRLLEWSTYAMSKSSICSHAGMRRGAEAGSKMAAQRGLQAKQACRCEAACLLGKQRWAGGGFVIVSCHAD